MPLKHIPLTQSVLSVIFLIHVATINVQTILEKNLKKKKKSAVYDTDTHVTLKQCQGHRNWFELVDPSKVITMQSLKNITSTVSAKKPTIKFMSIQESRQLSPLNMCES